jgi:hypothetical protein
MKLKFKEDPREWRKSTLLTVLGLALLSSLARCRHHLANNAWLVFLAVLATVAICAVFKPHWFRGWYRLSLRLGFYLSQFIGRCILAVFFIFILTPLGLILRLMGKDALQLKRPSGAKTYWHQARNIGPLDRLF